MKLIYRTITPERLTADVLRERSDQARVLYMHLNCGKLTCQIPGLVRAGTFALAEDTGYEPDVVARALGELVLHGLVENDPTARLIRLPGVPADHARLGTARNNVVGWINTLRQMPKSVLRTRHARDLREVCSPQLQETLWDTPEARELLEEQTTDESRADEAAPAPTPPAVAPPAGRSDPVRTREQEQEQEPPHPQRASAGEASAAPSPRSLGTHLRQAREAWGYPTHAHQLGLARSRLEDIEADRVLPTRDELRRLAEVYGAPELVTLPITLRDPQVVRDVVAEHHRRAVEMGRAPPGPPPAPTAADIKHVWSTGEGEQTRANWLTALARWHEKVNRAKGRPGDKSIDQFALKFLAHPDVRQDILSNIDLDKPRATSRAPPSSTGRVRVPYQGPGKFKNDDDDDA